MTNVNTTNFVEGENVILFCNVSGVPNPSVSWIDVTSMETVNNDDIWRLPNISRNNHGMYKCRANNLFCLFLSQRQLYFVNLVVFLFVFIAN